MVTGWQYIGQPYFFANSGIMKKNEWLDSDTYLTNEGHATTTSTYNRHVLIGGLKDRLYWADSSANNYIAELKAGFDRWKQPDLKTPFSWSNTSQKSVSDVELWAAQDDGSQDYIAGAETSFFVDGRKNTFRSENWAWCKITAYKNEMDQLDYDFQVRIMSHELGHVFGLDHNELYTNSVMRKSGYNITNPTYNDMNTIDGLYLYQ